MMQHLLRRLVFDVPLLNEHTKMPLKVPVPLRRHWPQNQTPPPA